MGKMYFTVISMDYELDSDLIVKGDEVTLERELDNKFDNEAIMVKLPGIGKIGYVANSTKTRIGDTCSAGRMYDKIIDGCKATVTYLINGKLVCSVEL